MFKKVALFVSLGVMSVTSTFSSSKNVKVTNAANRTITVSEDISVQDFADLLRNKNEHYPFSDEFIERYQQDSGGYIDYANQLGLCVSKALCEPNQKWHFFSSWYERTKFDEGDTAKKRVYTNLQCPELILWIYEACGVNVSKVSAAKKVAEQGKVQGIAPGTIAKSMRDVVAWTDLLENLK